MLSRAESKTCTEHCNMTALVFQDSLYICEVSFEAFVCSVQRWNQFQNYLIKTIETDFISLAIYITNNWISYGEWNECRYMYIEACM